MSRKLILPLVILEIFSQLVLVKYHADLASIIYLILGLAIGCLMMSAKKKEQIQTTNSSSLLWRNVILLTGILMLGAYAKDLFMEIPLDYKTADMLPIMQIMNERFLTGADPYEIIPEIWRGMQPIYLPGLWLSYLPAIAFDFDMRWVSVAGLCISSAVIYSNRQSTRQFISPLTILPLILLLVLIISVDSTLLTMTQESIIVLWYICMIWSLLNNRPYLFGLFAALSLLSRYTIAPWLLMIGILLIITKRISFFKRTVLIGITTLIILILISGAYQYSDVFLGLSDSYLNDIQSNQAKYQGLITHGLGIAKFFPYDQLNHLHSLMQYVAIITPIGLSAVYLSRRERYFFDYFALGSLKICLVLFYNMIIMPYSYLFYPSTFLSLLILVQLCKRNSSMTERL